MGCYCWLVPKREMPGPELPIRVMCDAPTCIRAGPAPNAVELPPAVGPIIPTAPRVLIILVLVDTGPAPKVEGTALALPMLTSV